MGRSQRKQFWVPSMVVTAVIAVVVCAWALPARRGAIAGVGKERRLGLPPPQRFGPAYAFHNLSEKQVRALARAFSQAEKLVLWLPNPESGQGEQMCLANVLIIPGRNWAYGRRGGTAN